MKISIFGTGYVGLVTGVCLAELGHSVLCIDIDEQKIQTLKSGISPIYEPGLTELLQKNIAGGRILFSSDPEEGILYSQAVFNAVGTPPDRENKNKADLKYVEAVAKTFGKYITRYSILINKSTVPVGTAKNLQKIINNELYKRKINIEFDTASNPEFLREGSAVQDFMNPDRIVIGTFGTQAKKILAEIYAPLVHKGVKIIFTDPASSEIIKYASNAFLATKISFINEIANFSEKTGGNIIDISQAMGADKRIGSAFLSAGLGYGGSCFPKDVKALIQTGKDFDFDFHIIKAAESVNNLQKKRIGIFVKNFFKNHNNMVVTIWGMAFKPNTDDTRDSVSIDIIHDLKALGVKKIHTHDPIIDAEFSESQGSNIVHFQNKYDSLKNSNLLILATDWDEYKIIDRHKVSQMMNDGVVFDGRNIREKNTIEKENIRYFSIGK